MKNRYFSLLLVCFSALAYAQNAIPAVAAKHLNSEMAFVENKGQLTDEGGKPVPQILFKSVGTGPQIYVSTSGMTFVFQQDRPQNANVDPDKAPAKTKTGWSKIEMALEGASIRSENVLCENALPGVSNYYYAHCPQGILGVRSFQKITVKNIYPGIDWLITTDAVKGMAYDFVVHPGSDPAKIVVNYSGMNMEKFAQDKTGRLVFVSDYGTLYEGGLNVYEKESGRTVAADYDILLGLYGCSNAHQPYIPNVTLSYNLGTVAEGQTLVIDPPLEWYAPQASSDFDYGYAISAAHDGSGDVLACGVTAGTDFPTQNAYQAQLEGFSDMVVVRLNSSGARLWSTYYGGTDDEQAKGIASDNSGNCYVTGNTTSSDFPVQNALQTNFGSGTDIAILKLNASGMRQWASWYGSFGNDFGMAIASDAVGNTYITGYTNSQFFTTLNPIQATKDVSYDAFIMKLNTSCVLQWATFYGGDDEDKARAIAIDSAGTNIYITGSTISGTYPSTPGVFQLYSISAYNYEDAFITKISASEVVQFSSFCGAGDADFGQGITVDHNGNIFVTGYTLSSNFQVVNPGNGAYIDNTIGSPGTHDAFVMECNSTGTTRLWSTYFGGSSVDMGLAITSDPTAGIYVCGNTASVDFPVQQPTDMAYYQGTQGDNGNFNDMFIAWFDQHDSLRWSTFYGDSIDNEANGICVDANSNIFVAGTSDNDLAVLKFNQSFPTGIPAASVAAENSIYPNPASESVFVNCGKEEGIYQVEIFNAQGQLVSSVEKAKQAGNSLELDVKALANGVYVLKVSSPEGKVEVERFVKE